MEIDLLAMALSLESQTDKPRIRENLIPLRAQNDSSTRAWLITLPESGLCEASTSSTLRLHPKVGLLLPEK